MTRQQAKQLLNNIPVLAAYAEGKTIQFRHSEGCSWADISNPNWVEGTEYRIKPEPRTVDWDSPEDVPMPVCWVSGGEFGLKSGFIESLVVERVSAGIYISRDGRIVFLRWDELQRVPHRYSTDGKTWKPCVKTMGGEL